MSLANPKLPSGLRRTDAAIRCKRAWPSPDPTEGVWYLFFIEFTHKQVEVVAFHVI